MTIDLSGKSILVVDDYAQITVSIAAMLRDAGTSVIDAAKSGEQALEMLAHRRYHLVICDFNLGDGKDGRQVLEEARHAGILGYATPFLMVTGENYLPVVMGAIEHRPDDYLVKPFVKEVLLQRIERLLRRKENLFEIDQAIEQNELMKAMALADIEIKRQAANTHDLLKLKAELAIRLQRYAQAKALYEQVLSSRPVLWARLGLAKTLLLQGACSEAQTLFQALIKENRYYIEAYDGLVEALECVGERQEAQHILSRALKISPTSARRQLRLARLAEVNDDPEAAGKALRAAIRFGKHSVFRDVESHLDLVRLQTEQGAVVKALKSLSAAREEFQKDTIETVRLAVKQTELYRQTSNNLAAEQAWRDAMNKFKSHRGELDLTALGELATACFNLKHPDQGSTVLEQMVSQYHDDPRALAMAQSIFDAAGLSEEGTRIIHDCSRKLIAINNKGVQLFREGRIAAAIELFVDAAKSLPRNRTINLNAAKALIAYMREHEYEPEKAMQVRRYLEMAKPEQDMPENASYNETVELFERFAMQAQGAA